MKEGIKWSIAMVLVILLTSVVQAETVITHLTYTSHGEPYNNYISRMAEEFCLMHPGVKIDIIVGNQEKMKTMMAGGVWPDILDMPDFDYLGGMGALIDVKPLLEQDGLLKSFNPILIEQLIQSNGAIYRAPFEVNVVASYFNRDMFNNVGVATPDRMSPKEWTWDAMMASARKLTRDLNGDNIIDQFGIDRVQNFYWGTAVFQAGGTFYEFDEKDQPIRSLWNTPEVLQGVQFVESMFRAKVTPFLSVNAIADYYFWQGKTAIDVTDGTGIINGYLKSAGFEWDFCLQPAGPAGPITHSAAIAGPHIMSNSKHVDLAWEWIKYFAMQREHLREWVQATGRMPALMSALSDYPALMNINTKNFVAVLEQANYPPIKQAPVDTSLNPRLVSLTPVWNGSTPPANFLQAQHDKATTIIEEIKARNAVK